MKKEDVTESSRLVIEATKIDENISIDGRKFRLPDDVIARPMSSMGY